MGLSIMDLWTAVSGGAPSPFSEAKKADEAARKADEAKRDPSLLPYDLRRPIMDLEALRDVDSSGYDRDPTSQFPRDPANLPPIFPPFNGPPPDIGGWDLSWLTDGPGITDSSMTRPPTPGITPGVHSDRTINMFPGGGIDEYLASLGDIDHSGYDRDPGGVPMSTIVGDIDHSGYDRDPGDGHRIEEVITNMQTGDEEVGTGVSFQPKAEERGGMDLSRFGDALMQAGVGIATAHPDQWIAGGGKGFVEGWKDSTERGLREEAQEHKEWLDSEKLRLAQANLEEDRRRRTVEQDRKRQNDQFVLGQQGYQFDENGTIIGYEAPDPTLAEQYEGFDNDKVQSMLMLQELMKAAQTPEDLAALQVIFDATEASLNGGAISLGE